MTPREQIAWWLDEPLYGQHQELTAAVVRAALEIIDRAHEQIQDVRMGVTKVICDRCDVKWPCAGVQEDEAALWKAIGGQE